MREASDENGSQTGSVSADARVGYASSGTAVSAATSATPMAPAAGGAESSPTSAAYQRAQQQEAARAIATQQLIYFESGCLPSSSSLNGPGTGGSSSSAAAISGGGGGNAWSSQKISLAQRLATGAPSTSFRALFAPGPGRVETPVVPQSALLPRAPAVAAVTNDVLLPGMDAGTGSQGGSSRLFDDDDDGIASVSTAFLSGIHDDSLTSAVLTSFDGSNNANLGSDVNHYLRRLRTISGTSEMALSDAGGSEGLDSGSSPMRTRTGSSASHSYPTLPLPRGRTGSLMMAPLPSSLDELSAFNKRFATPLLDSSPVSPLVSGIPLQSPWPHRDAASMPSPNKAAAPAWGGYDANHAQHAQMLQLLQYMQNQSLSQDFGPNPSGYGDGGMGYARATAASENGAGMPSLPSSISMPPGFGFGAGVSKEAAMASLTLLMMQPPYPSKSAEFPPLT